MKARGAEMRRGVLVLGLVLSLGGCGAISNAWNGLFGGAGQSDTAFAYRAKLKRGAEDRRNFVIAVRAGGATVGQVREAVRFQATRYCIKTYGASNTDWVLDPATGDWAFTRDGTDMVFQGRCTNR